MDYKEVIKFLNRKRPPENYNHTFAIYPPDEEIRHYGPGSPYNKEENDFINIAIAALEKLTPRNAQEELPEHPGDYLVQFANTDRLSVFHWTGDKWISQSNSWMWDKDSVKAWWTLPEVVKDETQNPEKVPLHQETAGGNHLHLELHFDWKIVCGGNMSKYILDLKAEERVNDMTIECETAQEVLHWKHKAEDQGYKVSVRKEKEEKEC